MAVRAANNSSTVCPNCHAPMQSWPALDGSGKVSICSQCDSAAPPEELERLAADIYNQLMGTPSPPSRFRELVKTESLPKTGELPQTLLEDLPPVARKLLSKSGEDATKPRPQMKPAPKPARKPPSEAVRKPAPAPKPPAPPKSVNPPPQPKPAVAPKRAAAPSAEPAAAVEVEDYPRGITPEDVALLATGHEVDLTRMKDRKRCPECDAVISTKRGQCPWCGSAVPS